MVGLVTEVTDYEPNRWSNSPQADTIRTAINKAGLVYLTTRQIDVILNGLQAGGHLAPATVDEPTMAEATVAHRYLSTACLHAAADDRPELHHHCATDTQRHDGTHKHAATCKWCPAQCTCPCHNNTRQAPA